MFGNYNVQICWKEEQYDSLGLDCSISSALVMEILQSCTKPSNKTKKNSFSTGQFLCRQPITQYINIGRSDRREHAINQRNIYIYILKLWQRCIYRWVFKTHLSLVPRMCIGELGEYWFISWLSPGQRQAIFWTNTGILLTWPLATNFSEILAQVTVCWLIISIVTWHSSEGIIIRRAEDTNQ